MGAKVNGKIVPLDYKLNNGDRVEVITSKTGRGPGNDWLDIVATQSAKSKIKKWLKDQKLDENIKIGKELIEKEVGKLGMTLKEFEDSPILKKHLEKHNIPTMSDFYFHMGETKSKVDVVVAKLKIEQEKSKAYIESNLEDFIKEPIKKKSAKKDDQGIIIDGTENTLIRFARCCTPLPGDDIGGYVTKLTGIAIHRKDCPNYISMVNHDPARVIDVNWDERLLEAPSKKSRYTFAFTIKAIDRQNILMDVVTMISNHKINVLSLNSHNIKKGLDTIAIIKVTVELNNKDEYKQLVSHLLKIKDVMSVER